MRWYRSSRFDRRAVRVADGHYSRQKPGTSQFVAPGSCLVLMARNAAALWVTLWQRAEFTDHAWPGAWNNSLFRNVGAGLSSELIREAVAATRWHYGEPPPNGMVTFIDVEATAAGRGQWSKPGHCYRKAGFREVGWTDSGRMVLQLLPHRMPKPAPPLTDQLTLELVA